MFTDSQPTIELNAQELEWLQKMRVTHNHEFNENSVEVFDVLRWCYGDFKFQANQLINFILAYDGDLQLASKKFKRHLRIRQILRLDHIQNPKSGHEIDIFADEYAPLTFLGNVIIIFK